MPYGTFMGACLGSDDYVTVSFSFDLKVKSSTYDVGLYVPVDEYAHSYTSPLRAWAASASWTPKFEALSPPSSIDYCHAAAAEMEEEAAGTEATAEITAPRVDPATTTTNAVRESAKDREGTNNAAPSGPTPAPAPAPTEACLPLGSGSCSVRYIGMDNKCSGAEYLVCQEDLPEGADCGNSACCPDGNGGWVFPSYCYIGSASCPCPEEV
eukprot:CAMPEP_0183712622 /NCGR_PEP_ID=MMETSP0737-20130205/7715_1 /TAXON_ID=385413 /ORGANISM="Thalassiosira miniscula, Strain CCMP1093" /LENGTH=210 /DNA_ID=CAMNT_0025941277 /DNA_START=630 /DNA_END=1262 /DNA_ORIENTATION=+